jgi:hypothetical protein
MANVGSRGPGACEHPSGSADGQRRLRPARPSARVTVGAVAATLALIALAAWPIVPARANHDPYCYVVGDNSSNQRILTRVTKSDFDSGTNEETIGVLGTLKTDGIGMNPATGVLYGVNTNMVTKVGVFGSISLSSGAFNAIGSGLGVADGTLGGQELYDVSGLAFDPATGFLYAAQVRTGSDTAVDLLFRVNVATGTFVPDAFGSGQDYVVLPKLTAFSQFNDVDDIAIDPAGGQMYGIMNNSTSGDRLIRIDKQTGATTDVGAFGVAEVEGLDFDPHGNLWATAGGVSGTEANKLYQVNKNTGAATAPRLLDNAADYEALACMTSASSPVPTATPTRTSPPPTVDPSLSDKIYLPALHN